MAFLSGWLESVRDLFTGPLVPRIGDGDAGPGRGRRGSAEGHIPNLNNRTRHVRSNSGDESHRRAQLYQLLPSRDWKSNSHQTHGCVFCFGLLYTYEDST